MAQAKLLGTNDAGDVAWPQPHDLEREAFEALDQELDRPGDLRLLVRAIALAVLANAGSTRRL